MSGRHAAPSANVITQLLPVRARRVRPPGGVRPLGRLYRPLLRPAGALPLIPPSVAAPPRRERHRWAPPPQMVHREGATPYGEVDALVTLLGYKTANAGCCKARPRPSARSLPVAVALAHSATDGGRRWCCTRSGAARCTRRPCSPRPRRRAAAAASGACARAQSSHTVHADGAAEGDRGDGGGADGGGRRGWRQLAAQGERRSGRASAGELGHTLAGGMGQINMVSLAVYYIPVARRLRRQLII